MTEPLLAALAARGETLTVAALPWVAPVYRAMPQVSEVVELPFQHGRLDWAGRRALARTWRKRFDAAYVLPNSIKSALLPWLARIPVRVGYHGEGRWLLLNRRLPNLPVRGPMVSFYLALAGRGDGDPGHPPAPRLQVDPARIAAASRAAGLEPGEYWAFAPGAEYGPSKRWPADRFAALARTLRARHGVPVALLGSGKEATLAAEIAALAPRCCVALAGKTSLDDAIALIAGSRGMVSNDSGLMHVTAAFGLPQAAVFGSTSPEHTPPINPRARVVWLKDELGLDCMPCFDRECRFGHYRCLREVAPGRVDRALEDALSAPPQRVRS